MEDCIFCKIVEGEIPCIKIYEDEHILSFLDIMPANKGHCLVIPKKHCVNILDTDEELFQKMSSVAWKVAKALSLSCGNGSYNLIMNSGKEAGQVVMHAHMHVIPRFKGDGHDLVWKNKKYSEEEMHKIADNIRKFMD